MVDRSGSFQAKVMIGGDGVCHIDIGAETTCQFDGLTDHSIGVNKVMGFVKGIVTGKDIPLDKLHQVKANVVSNHNSGYLMTKIMLLSYFIAGLRHKNKKIDYFCIPWIQKTM